jgi:hypothetical protein
VDGHHRISNTSSQERITHSHYNIEMRRARFREQERGLAEERSIRYRGTASIKLDVLHFPEPDNSNVDREPDKINVERLKNLFLDGGCRPDELRNHILAVIDQEQLDDAILASGTSAEGLLAEARDGFPELDFPPGYRLECLHGLDRVEAAKKEGVLPPGNKRWTVDLYLAGMSSIFPYEEVSNFLLSLDLTPQLKTTLIEEYSNEKKPDDGEIYRKIRGYQGYLGEPNPYFEKRWLALLSALSQHKRDNFDRLYRDHDFRAAFDSLLEIPGLDGGMRLSTTHKVMGKCREASRPLSGG